MILANSTWGGWLAACGVPGVYRSQASLAPGIKVRLGTRPAPHAGLGVAQYSWATSPLRRYVDLVNQWQIIACARHGKTAALAAPFKPKDAELFSIISSFDATYGAYNGYQAGMERFWTLKYLQQNQVTELDATVIKDGMHGDFLVRADRLPLVLPVLGAQGLPRGARVRVKLGTIDEITLDVNGTLLARLDDPALLARLLQRLAELRIDRHAFVVGIGGGAVLDLVGYAAASFHRGVRHVRVPTTVLAQNDSGIGVKNGVNAFGTKNLLGAFAPPFAVLNDAEFLRTLEPRDRIAGLAEAVKVALIRDRAFFEWIEAHAGALHAGESAALRRASRRCAELHMRQIAQGGDPFETGSARPLDYGHWSAHKLEALSAHELRHGEAVAIGMALDARYSVLAGLLAPGGDDRVVALLARLGFALWHPTLESHDADGRWQLLRGLDEFREHLGGELTITLLRDIGTGEEVHRMDVDAIARALAWLRHRECRA